MRLLSCLIVSAYVSVLAAADDLLPRAGTLPDLEIPPVEYLGPEEALQKIAIHPDFRLEVVAHEPNILAPIEIIFDELGRMWVLEMQDYMPNVTGEGEGKPVSRVVVLEDEDQDGFYEKRTVFLDGLILPRGMARVSDGIMLAEQFQMWHCADYDGDLVCDDRRSIGAYAVRDNIEHSENVLRRNLDNWYYAAKSDRRFQFVDGEMKVEQTYDRIGQWGLTHDNYGRRYGTSNSSFMRPPNDFPAHYAARSQNRDYLARYYPLEVTKIAHTIRPNPGIRNGNQMDALDERGHMSKCTAVAGLAAYRGGGGWPDDLINSVLVCEPAGNVAPLFQVSYDGFDAKANKLLVDSSKHGKHDFIASFDEVFRPVNVAMGPDGCMYLVDMRVPIVQHYKYMTDYLENQVKTRGLNEPITQGRVYRIVHKDGQSDFNYPNLLDADAQTLVDTLAHPNGFWRDQAQRLIVEDYRTDAVTALKTMITSSDNPLARMHGLWSLHGLSAMTADLAVNALESTDRHLRLTAMRTSEHLLASSAPLRQAVIALASNQDIIIQTQAILSLGEAAHVTEVQHALLQVEATGQAEKARISSLGQVSGPVLTQVADGKTTINGSLVKKLGEQIGFREDPVAMHLAVSLAVQAGPGSLRTDLLNGISHGLRIDLIEAEKQMRKDAAKKAKKAGKTFNPGKMVRIPLDPGPIALDPVSGFEQLTTDTKVADAVQDIGIYAHWIKPASNTGEDDPRLAMSLGIGKTLFRDNCASCHGDKAEGTDIAPSLMASDLVNGQADIPIRIVLHGLMGPREVGGKSYNSVMPGLGKVLGDQEIANVLTWVRMRRTKDPETAVGAQDVNAVRTAHADRNVFWNASELQSSK